MAINITYAKAAERIASQRQKFTSDMDNLFKQIEAMTRPEEKTGLQRMIEKIQEKLNKNYEAEDILQELNTEAKEAQEIKDGTTSIENIQNAEGESCISNNCYGDAPTKQLTDEEVEERLFGGAVPKAQESLEIDYSVDPTTEGTSSGCPQGYTPILDANGVPTGGCRKLTLQELNLQYESQNPNQISAPRTGLDPGFASNPTTYSPDAQDAHIRGQQFETPSPGGPTTAQTQSQQEIDREAHNTELEGQLAAGDCVCERTSDGSPYNPGVNRCVQWSPGCSPEEAPEPPYERFGDFDPSLNTEPGDEEGNTNIDYDALFAPEEVSVDQGLFTSVADATAAQKQHALKQKQQELLKQQRQKALIDKFKEKAMLAARTGAQSAGDLWNIKKGLEGPDHTSYSRLNYDPITGKETKQQIFEQGHTSRESLKQVAGATGAQAYLSGLSNIDRGVNTAIGQVDEQLANLNQQGKLSVEQYNSRVEILEEVANAQAKAKSDELLASGISGLGENIAGSMDDSYRQDLLKDIYPATDSSTHTPSGTSTSRRIGSNSNEGIGLSFEEWSAAIGGGENATEENYKKWKKERLERSKYGGKTPRSKRLIGRYKRRIKNSTK